MVKKADVIKRAFHSEVKKSFSLIALSNKSEYNLSREHKAMIVELCFLKVFLAWERLLEDTFIDIMMTKNTSRRKKVYSFVRPSNLKHAEEIIHEGENYSEWSYAETTKKAKRYLKKGFPFIEALQSISNYLSEMQTIRNRIAHNSRFSKINFESLVRQKIGYLPHDISCPGDFLLGIDKKTKKTFLEIYSDKLNSACLIITKYD